LPSIGACLITPSLVQLTLRSTPDRLLSRVPTVGYLEHRQSSLVVQIPRENGYDSGTPLVLGPLPPPTSTKHLFSLLPEADAELKHWASGVAVGPENDPQIRFIHKEAAAKTRYTFDAAAGTLLHSESGKYVRPLTIPATKDTKYVPHGTNRLNWRVAFQQDSPGQRRQRCSVQL